MTESPWGWRRFLVSASLIEETESLLRSYWKGRTRQEGLVYWGGRQAQNDILATTAFAPEAIATWGSITVPAEANTKCILEMKSLDLIHVAQVHSHPPGADFHSDGDTHGAFMKHRGLVSVVALDYGTAALWPFHCVFVYDGEDFVRVDSADFEKYFQLVPAARDLRSRGHSRVKPGRVVPPS